MNNPGSITRGANTQQIVPERWPAFLADFTRQNRGAHATLEILHAGDVERIVAEDRPFEGISADVKDRERAVWITFTDTPSDHFTHGVQGVTSLWVTPTTPEAGPALEVETSDGAHTLLFFTSPLAYALPPGAKS
ncbi:MAG TPA: DUF5335 family protein [Bryobacteraceae bacterium]|nr:DUF5335 family protein [Bryobacteraceae bacterium]